MSCGPPVENLHTLDTERFGVRRDYPSRRSVGPTNDTRPTPARQECRAYDGTHVVFQSKMPEGELAEAYWRCFREAYSVRNGLAAVATNVRNAKNKPAELLRSLFIQGMFRSKVMQKQHPLSGGFGRIAP